MFSAPSSILIQIAFPSLQDLFQQVVWNVDVQKRAGMCSFSERAASSTPSNTTPAAFSSTRSSYLPESSSIFSKVRATAKYGTLEREERVVSRRSIGADRFLHSRRLADSDVREQLAISAAGGDALIRGYQTARKRGQREQRSELLRWKNSVRIKKKKGRKNLPGLYGDRISRFVM